MVVHNYNDVTVLLFDNTYKKIRVSFNKTCGSAHCIIIFDSTSFPLCNSDILILKKKKWQIESAPVVKK